MGGRLASRSGWAAALLGASLLLGAPPPAGAGCGGVVTARPTRDLPGRAPLVIGDSVLLGAVDDAAGAGYRVNARGCRQMSEGLDVMRAYRRAGRLPAFVVVFLGANLSLSPAEVEQALRIAAPRRRLGLVTPRETGGASGSDARVVRAAGRRHPERVVVLDWAAYSAGHSSWFAQDGLHLGRGGAEGLARLLERGYRDANPLGARLRAGELRRGRGNARFRTAPTFRRRPSAWSRSMAATTLSAAIAAPACVRWTPSGWRTVARRPR